MKTKVVAITVFTLMFVLAVSSFAAKYENICTTEYNFPDGFNIAAFGMSDRHIQQFFACGMANLGDEDGTYSAAGKIDKVDVIYEFTVTPKARKLFQISLETLNSDLFNNLRSSMIKKLGQPSKDKKGRDTWEDASAGASLKMYRSKAYYKVKLRNDSFLVEEAMGYFCDKAYALPDGVGNLKFGASKEEVYNVLGCGLTFVSRDSTRITAKGYAFNQKAKVYLDFASDKTLKSVEYVIADVDSYALIDNILKEKFGAAPSAGASAKLWTVGTAQVSLSKSKSSIRIKYTGQ